MLNPKTCGWPWCLILFFSLYSSYLFAGSLVLPSYQRWLIIASRPTIQEATPIAQAYRSEFKNTDILLATNGWYAITIGAVEYPKNAYVLDQLISKGTIPSDSRFASGNGFIMKVTNWNSQQNDSVITESSGGTATQVLSKVMCTCGCEYSARMCIKVHQQNCPISREIRAKAWNVIAEYELKNEMCSCGCERSILKCLKTHPGCNTSKARAESVLINIIKDK